MNRKPKLKILQTIAILIWLTTACKAMGPEKEFDLEATIESQNTQLAQLNTQVVLQNQVNNSQWDAISYLSTQMPFALELITPIPEGITITPTPSIDIEYPPDTRTGIAEIDSVIDAIMAPNIINRIELVRFILYPCTTENGLGGPPKCEGDEVDGTVVETFPVLYSEGVHVRPEIMQSVFNFHVRGLLAVYRVPNEVYKADYWPAGEYAVVFTSEDGGFSHTITFHVTGGQIVRLEFNMDWPPFDRIWESSDAFILPPSTREQPTPVPVCTPPACSPDEVYYCLGECPGGCGTTCATATPSGSEP